MQSSYENVRCPITKRMTGSCSQCALFKVPASGGAAKCGAKKGQKYHMIVRPESGDFWDTYVMTAQEIKDADAGHGQRYIEVRAKGGI
jgi:hypothetical protein